MEDMRKFFVETMREALQSPEGQTLIRTTVEQVLEERGVEEATPATIPEEEVAKAVVTAMREVFSGGRPRKERAEPQDNHRKREGQTCMVIGCDRPYRAMGYCATHYQAARRYGWPLPATEPYRLPESYRPRSRRRQRA